MTDHLPSDQPRALRKKAAGWGLHAAPAAIFVLVCSAAGATAQESAPEASQTKTFSNVTARTLACVEDRSRKQNGTVYTVDGRNPNIVTSDTHYFGWTRTERSFDAQTATATYRILRKPALASYGQIWTAIRDAIKACS
jgi:hypothetical protein